MYFFRILILTVFQNLIFDNLFLKFRLKNNMFNYIIFNTYSECKQLIEENEFNGSILSVYKRRVAQQEMFLGDNSLC